MSASAPAPEQRALILAPLGRDSAIAAKILTEARIAVEVCCDLAMLVRELHLGAALALVSEEALQSADLTALAGWVNDQPPWSDLPFVLLAHRGGGLERNPGAARLMQALGNVTFLERPFHPTTLVSVVQTAMRGRRRQYEARQRIEELRTLEAQLERRVEERTAELEGANLELAAQIVERERVETALHQAQRLEAVGQLTAGVAHDFNNLLTVILGNVSQLRKVTDDTKALQRLDMMVQAGERGARLTAQMLAFSRRQKLEPRTIDLNDTLNGMRQLLHSTIGGSVRLTLAPQPNLWSAVIDPTQIELAILNLAINARDAMPGGGELTIQTGNVTLGSPARPEEPAPGDYVMVSVTDNGTGMTEAVFTKAFEPFFTTKEVGKGSGLGLSQVFGLAKQSGGGVRIETTVGEGTSVRIYLPRAAADEASAEAPEGVAPDRAAKAGVVLVVDDDSLVREVTVGMLSDLGYAVLEAEDGPGAIGMLERHAEISLVLLDYAMPGMNGGEVARETKARRPDLPILLVTGYADADSMPDLDVLQKPFLEQELAERLAEITDGKLGRVSPGLVPG